MTPEQLRDHIYGKWDVRDTIRRRAIREGEDKDVEEACAKYRRKFVREVDPDKPLIHRIREVTPDNPASPFDETFYEIHTTDKSHHAPRFVEDEMLVVERGWRRAKSMWLVLIVVVIASVVYQLT